MPDTIRSSDKERLGFQLTMMFHPNLHVSDLRYTERWFEDVFGCRSTSLETLLARRSPQKTISGQAADYATFTVIQDVLIESMDPRRLLVEGVQRYETVDQPHLRNFGWYVEQPAALLRRLRLHGFDAADINEDIVTGDAPPMPTFFSSADQTGLRYQFWGGPHLPFDPRTEPGWILSAPSADDPLGIERCSHHTILTHHPERAAGFLVDALGGVVIHDEPSLLRGTSQSTYIELGGSILEYGVPGDGTEAHADWAAGEPGDTYHAITWKVADLDRAVRHLESQGVRIGARSDDTVITQAGTSLGVPWGFTTRSTPASTSP